MKRREELIQKIERIRQEEEIQGIGYNAYPELWWEAYKVYPEAVRIDICTDSDCKAEGIHAHVYIPHSEEVDIDDPRLVGYYIPIRKYLPGWKGEEQYLAEFIVEVESE